MRTILGKGFFAIQRLLRTDRASTRQETGPQRLRAGELIRLRVHFS